MVRIQNRTAGWVGGAVLMCLVIVVATWFGLVSPRRSEVADLQSRNESAISANQVLQTQIEQLKAQFRMLPQMEGRLRAIRGQLPGSTRMSDVVRALSGLADSTGVTLRTITPSAAEAVGAKAGNGQPAAGQPSDGLVAVPLSIIVTGDYFQSVAFLRGLQTGLTRAFLVSSLQIEKQTGVESEDTDVSTVQVTVSGKIFSLLDAAAKAEAAGKGAPSTASGAGGGTPPASPGASPGTPGESAVTFSPPATPPPPAPLPTEGAVAAAATSTVQAGGPQW